MLIYIRSKTEIPIELPVLDCMMRDALKKGMHYKQNMYVSLREYGSSASLHCGVHCGVRIAVSVYDHCTGAFLQRRRFRRGVLFLNNTNPHNNTVVK